MFIRILFIFALTLGACAAARSQTYNEYNVWFGKERKVGKKIVFDTMITKMTMTAQSSKSHKIALDIANQMASDYGMKARVKYIRRLKSTEEKKVVIYH